MTDLAPKTRPAALPDIPPVRSTDPQGAMGGPVGEWGRGEQGGDGWDQRGAERAHPQGEAGGTGGEREIPSRRSALWFVWCFQNYPNHP